MASVGPSPIVISREKGLRMLVLLASIWASSSMVRILSLPVGSPILVVAPPIRMIGLCPVCCMRRSIMICTSEPTCSEDAVASNPI